MGHVLSSHDSVEHLVEVDDSIIHIDAHLEDDPIDFLLRSLLTHANFPFHICGELIEELVNILDLHADALVATCEHLPGFLELFEIFLEATQRVILLEIVLVELLDDDKDEQIEHDIADNHVE